MLRPEDMPAVDYPQPGGLTWDELHALVAEALAAPGCAGLSIVIYNPDLDPSGDGARRVVAFVEGLL